MLAASLVALALIPRSAPQDVVPTTVAFHQACLDATTDALVMNVAAHPDDESARTMVLLRNRYGVRTVTVYSTCGEGGQNAIGRDIGPALAAIRVGETRAAAARYGTEIRWLGFPDFGFSKSLDETLAVWGRDATLERMRATLAAVGPDVVVTNHSIDVGHGHHRASWFAIEAACRAAPDGPIPLFQRAARPTEGEAPVEPLFEFDAGALDPVRGATFARQAHDAWTLHQSQGPWSAHDPTTVRPDLWRQVLPETTEPAPARSPVEWLRSMFDEPAIARELDAAGRDALRAELDAFGDDRAVAVHVAAARRLLPRLRDLGGRVGDAPYAAARVQRRIDALERVVALGAGVVLDAWLVDDQVALGADARVRAALRGVPCDVTAIRVAGVDAIEPEGASGYREARVPLTPALLDDPIVALTRTVPLRVEARITLDGTELTLRRELVVRLAPDREIAWERPFGYASNKSAWRRTSFLEITRAPGPAATWQVSMRAPAGFECRVFPGAVRFADGQRSSRALVEISWTPTDDPAFDEPVEFVASVDGAKARFVLVPIALDVANQPIVGLVRGPDDTIERALFDLGVPLGVLDEATLATTDLERLSTILIDMRAYSHRPDLAAQRDRLLAYCRAGGRIVAFYHKEREWNEAPGKPLLAPFALEVGSARVSEEDAPITMLEPTHPLWNAPFRITPADFEGWQQERGLNFPSKWDPAWVPLLSMHDRGEEPQLGSLLYTRYGRGDFVYCSLALYRQLRIGHQGAMRILLNLLTAPSGSRPADVGR